MSRNDGMAVALLAGGESRRFGSDKACHVPGGSAEPLWKLQLDKLRSTGAGEILLSVGPAGPGFTPPADVRLIRDEVAGQGPLGGLAAILVSTGMDRVLVLAVDMPGVAAPDLSFLAGLAPAGRGVVPRKGGRWEPLLAVYPRSLAGLAREMLGSGRRSLQGFVEEAVRRGVVEPWDVPAAAEGWFLNLNDPNEGTGPDFPSGKS